MGIDLEQLKTEQATLAAEVAAATAEIETRTAQRDRSRGRLQLVNDLVRLAELYAGRPAPADEIPL